MVWNAGKQLLACPYCGFVPKDQPARGPSAADAIEERDLEAALANASDDNRGYGQATTQVKCQSCKAISVFPPGRVAQRCEFCASPAVVPYADTKDAITPESLLPVRIDEGRVRDLLRQWYASRWFAPNRLKSAALTDTLHGIYLPYWTFDAQSHADWQAESGDYYYETVTRRGANGNTIRTQERRVRWYRSSGSLDHTFDDDLVPGTAGVRVDLLRKVEPFPTTELAPYDPAFVRGWTVERYQIDLRQAETVNRDQMHAHLTTLCAREVPGDTHRNLQVHATFTGRTFKHILVPVWLVTYTFGSKTYHTLLNGHTGTIAGDRPVSWVKVFFYIILPTFLLIAIFLASYG